MASRQVVGRGRRSDMSTLSLARTLLGRGELYVVFKVSHR